MKMLNVHICRNCKSYCDSEECYFCHETTGELLTLKYIKEEYMQKVLQVLDTLNQETVSVMLSEFGDAPAEVATIEFNKSELISTLENHDFIFNEISSVRI